MSVTTKIIADVSPDVKDKLIALKQTDESNKDVLVRLIEKEYKKVFKN